MAAGKPTTLGDQVDDYLAQVGWASPTDIAAQIGANRGNVSAYLNAATDRYNHRAAGRKVEYSRKSYA